MTSPHATYGGPAVRKTDAANPTEVMTRLLKQNQKVPRREIVEMFVPKILADEDMVIACIKYFGWNAYDAIFRRDRKGRFQIASQNRESETRQMASAFAEKIRRAVILSELLMQNGKKLSDCTGIEMIKFGGFYAKIGREVGRKKVGAVLSEDQLQKMWKVREVGNGV